METTQTSTIASKDSRSAWRKTDTMWMLGLYGTAIGAGVLLLEGLDLSKAEPGEYTLAAFPLYVRGLEAALTRAVLIAEE